MRYRFRDPTGRLVGEPPGEAPDKEGEALTAMTTSVAQQRGDFLTGRTTAHPGATEPASATPARLTTGHPPAAHDPAAPTGADGTPGRPDLERVTDPMTGMAVPAFFVAR